MIGRALFARFSKVNRLRNLQNVEIQTNLCRCPSLSNNFSFTFKFKACSTSTSSTLLSPSSLLSSREKRSSKPRIGLVELTSLEYFSSYLSSEIVFQDENIIAISKQPGLSVFGSPSSENIDEQSLSIVHTLPQLFQHLGLEELEIGLSLKSYYSGLVLLTKNTKAAEKLQKVLSSVASQKKKFLTYLAIVVGKPQCEIQKNIDLYLERQYLHERQMTVIYDKSVHSSRKVGKMVQISFSLRIISSNDSTFSSLVEIKISKDKWDVIPALLSHYLSPVLGDCVYFSRTNYLMDVPVSAPPHIALPGGQQRLPLRTENALWDCFKLGTSPLPLFLHRSQVKLPNFPSHSSMPYEITAPPPAAFATALDCLGLQLSSRK